MKKVLSLVLVLTLVLGSFSFAFAAPASDVAGTEYEDAVKVLESLGVLTGFPDGTFRPNETITRAQFAAVIVRVSGNADAAAIAKGTTVFTDVPATHWASGEINIASKLGYVNGMGDGKFSPDSPVTYEQAVTMIVRALGYGPMAEKKGGYPYGFLSVASEKEMTKDVKGIVGVSASRGLVAQILFKSLDVNMMVQKSYGDLEQFEESNDTFLSRLGIVSQKAKIASVNDKKATLDARFWNDNTKRYETRSTTLKVDKGVVATGLEDVAVELWIKLDKVTSSNHTVINIIEKSEVIYDYIASVTYDMARNASPAADDVAKSIKLKNLNTTFDIAQDDSGNYLAGFERQDVTTGPSFTLKNVYVRVVLENDEIISLDMYEMVEGGLISEVKEDVLTYVKGNTTRRLRDLDDAESMLVLVNDELAEYDDLEEEMYFEYFVDADDNYVLVATDKTITGEFDRVKRNSADASREARIDGTYTTIAGTVYVSKDEGANYSSSTAIDDLLKEEVVAHLNTKGQIAYIKAKVDAPTTKFYGFVVNADPFDERVRIVRAVDGVIKTVTYDSDLPTTDLSATNLSFNNISTVDPVNAINNFYLFSIDEDGVIVKAATPDKASYASTSFNSTGDFIATGTDNVYAEDAIIFNAADPTDIKLLTWKGIEGAGNVVVNFTTDDVVASYIVITGGNTASLSPVTATRHIGFVTGKYRMDSRTYEYDLETVEGKVTYSAKSSTPNVNQLLVYEIISEEDGTAKVVASAVYDNLTAIANGYTAGSGSVAQDGIDGNYITVGSTTLRVAKNALIIEVVDAARGVYSVADLSDIYADSATVAENDTVYYLVKDGMIRALFFKSAE